MSNVFKEFRESRKLTQVQAGDLLGVCGSVYSLLERRKIKGSKSLGYELALKHIDHSDIYSEITEAKVFELKRKGVSLKQISIKMGHSDNIMSGLMCGHVAKSKKFNVLFNAVYLEFKLMGVKNPKFADIKDEPVKEPFKAQSNQSHQDQMIKFDKSQLRIETVNDEPWFCLQDVCKSVDYTNTQHALLLIEIEDVQKLYTLANDGKEYLVWFVSEPGLYQFLLSSNMPKAKQFRKWVTSEILPSIRKTGQYSQHSHTAHQPPSIGIEDLARLIGLKNTQLENTISEIQNKVLEINELQEKVEFMVSTIPDFEDVTETAVNRVFQSFQDLDGKKVELKQTVKKVVYLASKLPKNDPLFKYSTFPATYNDCYLFATPVVSNINKFVSEAQIQGSIDRAKVILNRLAGKPTSNGQTWIDFDEKQ